MTRPKWSVGCLDARTVHRAVSQTPAKKQALHKLGEVIVLQTDILDTISDLNTQARAVLKSPLAGCP